MNKSKQLLFLFSFLFVTVIFVYGTDYSRSIYKKNVEASYYADKFHGRKTANGEIFNMYAMTAAHKTLPFGTLLEVTNLENGKKVIVRVNDRGPFVKGREIDLAKGAAVKLDMIRSGTAKVSLVILKTKSVETSKTNNDQWRIQIGSYSSEKNAYEIVKKLRKVGLEPKYEKLNNGKIIRVVLPFIDDDKLITVENLLKSSGFSDYLVRKE